MTKSMKIDVDYYDKLFVRKRLLSGLSDEEAEFCLQFLVVDFNKLSPYLRFVYIADMVDGEFEKVGNEYKWMIFHVRHCACKCENKEKSVRFVELVLSDLDRAVECFKRCLSKLEG